MRIIDMILGRKSVYTLRKQYDRLREKADKEPDMNRKIMILRSLDQVEPTLVALEEQILSGFERKRMSRYINQTLQKTKKILKDEEYYAAMLQSQRRR